MRNQGGNAMGMHETWLRTPQVRRILGVDGRPMCHRTLYRLIESGQLRARDIGDGVRRCYIFHPSYIDDFRAATEHKKPEE